MGVLSHTFPHLSTAIAKIVTVGYYRTMTLIQKAARAAIKQHGGLRKAARALGMSPAYLCRLQNGERTNGSPETLAKLGIRKRVVFSEVRCE